MRINNNIRIRPIEYSDTPAVVRWRNNPRVVNNFLYRGPFTEQIHNQWMDTKVRSGEVIQFIIEYDELPVGSVYFRDVELEAGSAEYGIFIGEDSATGLGIGTAVAKWAVDYAKNTLNLKTLILRVLSDNEAAIRSYKSAGFEIYDRIENYIDNRDLLLMKIEF